MATRCNFTGMENIRNKFQSMDLFAMKVLYAVSNLNPEDKVAIYWNCQNLYVTKVDVQTGKKGYYRRRDATEKAVEETAQVYDGFSNVGDHSAEKHFAMSSKEVLPKKSQAISAADLMFFQSSVLAPAPLSLQFGTSKDKQLAIGDNIQQTNDIKTEGDVNSSDDDEMNSTAQGSTSAGINPLKNMAFALPKSKVTSINRAAAKAAAKGAAKATATAKVSAKAKPNAGGKKRKAETQEVEDISLVIHTLEPPSNTSVGDLQDDDQKVVDDFDDKLTSRRNTLFDKVADNEASITDSLKAGSKSLGTLHAAIKQKLKSAGRRKNKDVNVFCSKLENIDEEATSVQTVINGLTSSTGEDCDHIEALLKFSKIGWVFSPSIKKRAFKCAMLSHLKYGEWAKMTGKTRDLMKATLGDEIGSLA